MNNDIAIRVDGLGKMYRIGKEKPRARSLPGRIGQTLASPFDWLVGQIRGPSDDEILWALRNVSFEVKKGEVIGVIGRNGAGKSTLLKILSRITEPSEGRAEIHGRIASLLEVGTGMHLELTGRENIYLNGCILGMRKWEIDAKFDEIVDFSGIAKFLDTPVKRYSSGMRVRLGFAIAAHLEPEILLVDEVLAVGDAEFQKKCLGKMEDVAGHGKTVIFVSHQMGAIRNLCGRCLVLAQGKTCFDGKTQDGISRYLTFQEKNMEGKPDLLRFQNRRGNGAVKFSSFFVEDDCGQEIREALSGQAVTLVFELAVSEPSPGKINVGFTVHSSENDTYSILYSSYQNCLFTAYSPGLCTIRCRLSELPFNTGKLYFKGRLTCANEEADWLKDPLGSLTILDGDFFGTGKKADSANAPFLIKGNWSITEK